MNNGRILLGGYIKKMRKKAGVSVDELCRGLCSRQKLYAVEGERQGADKLLLDMIMERLGVGAEDYEHFLDYPDYRHWEDRQHILHAITFEEFETAGERLEKYYAAYCKAGSPAVDSRRKANKKLEMQYYLCMRTLLRCCTGGTREELEEGYRRALELTVPELEQRPLAEQVLSLKELNLILEVEQYRADGGRLERYREVLAYIEAGNLDEVARAKVYPKAVYFLCRRVISDWRAAEREKFGNPLKNMGDDWTDVRLLQYCNKAYEALQKGGRMYFLWEILSMREFFLESIRGQWVNCGEVQKADSLRLMLMENKKFRLTLERLYQEFGVRKETFEFCYLYVMKEVYCVNDVIRIRRCMLNMSTEKLYRGICTAKTLCNIENNITASQRSVAAELFGRLGLPEDRTKTDIVTDDLDARRLERQLRDELNENKYDRAAELLKELKAKISAEIPCNRQLLEKQEALINRHLGRISKEEYRMKIREALEITLPLGAFLTKGEKYLTNLEQACLLNMMDDMDRECEECLVCMRRFEEMYQPVIQAGMQETVENMYELIMGSVGSLLGNRGKYDRADEINETIIRGCLRFRRVGILHVELYDRWWNHNEREKKGIPTNKGLRRTEELERCIQFAEFTQEENDVLFYKKKLDG